MTNSAADRRDKGGAALAGVHIGRVAAPLREQVVSILRQAILDFQLKPGQRLVERELIERLGVSRTTVREVLRQLSAEGLITVIPQKGAIVAVPTAADAADLYEMRVALEVMAVRRFVERASREHHAALQRAQEAIERTSGDMGKSRSKRPHGQLRAKDEFYAALLAGAGSPPLEQMLGTLQARVRVLRATSLSAPGRPAEAAAEIRAIVEAIEAGDADRAAEACAYHIRRAARAGLAQLAILQAGPGGRG